MQGLQACKAQPCKAQGARLQGAVVQGARCKAQPCKAQGVRLEMYSLARRKMQGTALQGEGARFVRKTLQDGMKITTLQGTRLLNFAFVGYGFTRYKSCKILAKWVTVLQSASLARFWLSGLQSCKVQALQNVG